MLRICNDQPDDIAQEDKYKILVKTDLSEVMKNEEHKQDETEQWARQMPKSGQGAALKKIKALKEENKVK